MYKFQNSFTNWNQTYPSDVLRKKSEPFIFGFYVFLMLQDFCENHRCSESLQQDYFYQKFRVYNFCVIYLTFWLTPLCTPLLEASLDNSIDKKITTFSTLKTAHQNGHNIDHKICHPYSRCTPINAGAVLINNTYQEKALHTDVKFVRIFKLSKAKVWLLI